VELYQANLSTRKREELFGIDPTSDPLRIELASEKFTVLVSYSTHEVEVIIV
jgi:hypothetical protein